MGHQDNDDDLELFLKAVKDFEDGKVDIDKDEGDEEGEQKTGKTPTAEELVIDLHGCTVQQAKKKIERVAKDLTSQPHIKSLRIITGKGRHSEFSPVLPREAYDHAKKVFSARIKKISECPADLVVNGLPIRGHFDISLK